MSAENDKPVEEWVPLKPEDVVFYTQEEGNVVALPADRGLFGAIVRKRNGGVYMKRIRPLKILDPDIISAMYERKAYKQGEHFLT